MNRESRWASTDHLPRQWRQVGQLHRNAGVSSYMEPPVQPTTSRHFKALPLLGGGRADAPPMHLRSRAAPAIGLNRAPPWPAGCTGGEERRRHTGGKLHFERGRGGGGAVDTDLLAEYGEAGIDLGFRPAKYRVARPAASGRRDENDTVNVYPSGKVVCLGARSVERARADARMVLRRLGAPAWEDGGDSGNIGAAVRYVVMSGCIFGGHDVHKAIPRLREKYEVTLDSDVFSGYFVRSKIEGDGGRDGGDGGDGGDGYDGGVSIQVFAPDDACDAGPEYDDDTGGGNGGRAGGRTPLLCRGPTVRDIRRVVGDVYRTIAETGGGLAARGRPSPR